MDHCMHARAPKPLSTQKHQFFRLWGMGEFTFKKCQWIQRPPEQQEGNRQYWTQSITAKKTKSKSNFLNFLRGFNSLSHATSPHLLDDTDNFDVLKFFERVDIQHHCNALQTPFMFRAVWNLFYCHFDNAFFSKILYHSYEVSSLHKAVKTAHAWIGIDTCPHDYLRNFASSVKWFHSNACLD